MESRDRLRELIAQFDWEPDWLAVTAQAMTDAAHTAAPDLYGDEEISAGTHAEIESILRQVLYMVQNGVSPEEATLPPVAAEQARQFVRRGASLERLLRSYQVGHAAFFREWARAAHDLLDDPAELAEALEQGANWTFEYVEALSAKAVAEYREEADRWVRSAAAIRRETVDALLAGAEADPDVAGRRLGYALTRSHLAFVVWAEDAAGTSGDATLVELERAGERLASSLAGGKPLLVPLGSGTVAGWVGAGDGPGRVEHLAPDSRFRAAVGSEASGPAGFRTGHEQALQARRVAELIRAPQGSVTDYRDVALIAVASTDGRQARRFVIDELGPLVADDEATVRLATTLRVFLEENMSPRRAARRLRIHENTVTNRVRAAEGLLGHPVATRACELEVALRMVAVAR